MTTPNTADRARAALRRAATDALRREDRDAVAALRSAGAAIDNAEAVPDEPFHEPGSSTIAGSSAGVGSTERPRNVLSVTDVVALICAERDDLIAAAAEYERLGRVDAAHAARRGAVAVEAVLDGL